MSPGFLILQNRGTLPPRCAGTIAKMSAITFLLSPSMTKDDLQTELYGRIANLPSGPDKKATEAILCIGVAYENIRTTGRAAAANAKTTYVEPTRAEYEKMIDGTESSFRQPLANAHSDLDAAFDALVSKNKYNVNYTGSGSVAANLDQQRKVVIAMHTLMKDCNNMLTKALCLALSTDDMSAYTHLVQLDFIKDATSAKTMFGRIPPDDVKFPHTQTFNKLLSEIYRTNSLLSNLGTLTSQFSLHPPSTTGTTNKKAR